MLKSILSALALLSALSVNAQHYVNVGVGYGHNLTYIDEDQINDKPFTAVVAGVSHNFTLYGSLGLEAGLNYCFETYREESSSLTSQRQYNGFKAPVELNYRFEMTPSIDIKLFAGPSLNLGLSDRESNSISGNTILDRENFKEGYYNRFMVGGIAGVSVESSCGLRLKAGFDYGFSDRDKADVSSLKKSVLTINLGWSF